MGVLCEFGGDDASEAFAEEFVAFVGFHVIGALDHPARLGLGFLMAQPIGVAAFAPVREVLFGDGLALELFPQDAPDWWQGVQPLDEFGAGPGVLKTVVELVADFFGEAPGWTPTVTAAPVRQAPGSLPRMAA